MYPTKDQWIPSIVRNIERKIKLNTYKVFTRQKFKDDSRNKNKFMKIEKFNDIISTPSSTFYQHRIKNNLFEKGRGRLLRSP